MALIIYPDALADSFITVANATTVINTLTLNEADWALLSVASQEILLRIAFNDIIDHTNPTTYPDPIDACVGEAQALMAVHDTVNSISGGAVTTTQQIKKQKAGPIEREFFESATAIRATSAVPNSAQACLSRLGYVFSSTSGLKQTILGRS